MTFTGAELIAKVRRVADIQSNTARHTDAELLDEINSSIAAYRRMAARYDATNFATTSVYSTVASVPTLALAGTEELLAVICISQNINTTLHPAGLNDQAAYIMNGRPAMYRLQDLGSVGSSVLVMYPTPDTAYQINVQYIPTPPTVTTSTAWSPEVAGGERWVVADVAVYVATRDNHPRLASLQMERSRQEAFLKDLAMRTREPGHRSDTRGQRRMNAMLARRRI